MRKLILIAAIIAILQTGSHTHEAGGETLEGKRDPESSHQNSPVCFPLLASIHIIKKMIPFPPSVFCVCDYYQELIH